MALFGRNKSAVVEQMQAPEQAGARPAAQTGSAGYAHILRHVRITEKASMHSGAGVYTFDIAENATKRDVIAAIRSLYNVVPVKVAVVRVPSKARRSMRTGKMGYKRGGRKAYVYLKKGETITNL